VGTRVPGARAQEGQGVLSRKFLCAAVSRVRGQGLCPRLLARKVDLRGQRSSDTRPCPRAWGFQLAGGISALGAQALGAQAAQGALEGVSTKSAGGGDLRDQHLLGSTGLGISGSARPLSLSRAGARRSEMSSLSGMLLRGLRWCAAGQDAPNGRTPAPSAPLRGDAGHPQKDMQQRMEARQKRNIVAADCFSERRAVAVRAEAPALAHTARRAGELWRGFAACALAVARQGLAPHAAFAARTATDQPSSTRKVRGRPR